jgi:hypothetical protein
LKSFEKKLREKSSAFKDFVVSPSGEVKMSEVLEDFIEPYRKSNETKGFYANTADHRDNRLESGVVPRIKAARDDRPSF